MSEQAPTEPLDCPNCENVGWYAWPNTRNEEPEQVPCEWCRSVPGSKFNHNELIRLRAELEGVEDHKRLVRELDVLLNGDKAAAQASLCDIVAQVRKYSERLREVLGGEPTSIFLDQLKDVSNRALDNMEGEDLQGFKNWEAVHVKSRELWVAIKTAEAKNG